jgi:hypothetical protein
VNPIITIAEADLLAILGDNGEHWVQGTWGDDEGSVCLHGAIRRCQPISGDAYLIQQVADRQGWGTSWNDGGDTTWPMVRERLAHVEVTDADLADTFGPQWGAIVALVRRVAVLTVDEVQRLAAAWDAVDTAWDAVDTARAAAGDAGDAWDAAWVDAWVAAWDAGAARDAWAAWAAAWGAARAVAGAAGAAAAVLAVRDLIGQHGFTQEHYDTLTMPWRTVIGPVHPGDAEVGE